MLLLTGTPTCESVVEIQRREGGREKRGREGQREGGREKNEERERGREGSKGGESIEQLYYKIVCLQAYLVPANNGAIHVISLDPHLVAIWQTGEVPLVNGRRTHRQLHRRKTLCNSMREEWNAVEHNKYASITD